MSRQQVLAVSQPIHFCPPWAALEFWVLVKIICLLHKIVNDNDLYGFNCRLLMSRQQLLAVSQPVTFWTLWVALGFRMLVEILYLSHEIRNNNNLYGVDCRLLMSRQQILAISQPATDWPLRAALGFQVLVRSICLPHKSVVDNDLYGFGCRLLMSRRKVLVVSQPVIFWPLRAALGFQVSFKSIYLPHKSVNDNNLYGVDCRLLIFIIKLFYGELCSLTVLQIRAPRYNMYLLCMYIITVLR